jgi:glycosyltransferase-like protein
MTPRRIAILTHSTNPRGGVVHALALGDALTDLGHDVVVHAPSNSEFFRHARCETISVPATPTGSDLVSMVEARVADYSTYFETPRNRQFDIFHAQDSISANALADLKQRGLIAGFARTVHHIDSFDIPRLMTLQARAITEADRHFVVSELWRDRLAKSFGLVADIVGNGVDTSLYSSAPDANDAVLHARLGLGAGPIFLCIGGVEERKNTRRALAAFRILRATHPTAQLVIAGGASLLDHQAYQGQFLRDLAEADLPDTTVIRTGKLPHSDMPALYRNADALLFPSVKEGFGLVVIEAMASGLPVITSAIAPFTEYLQANEAIWCDPYDTTSITAAMRDALSPSRRLALIARGADVAARHDWRTTALAHLPAYESLEAHHHA